MKFLTTNKYLFLLIATVVAFFSPFFVQGKLPIPADALVGLYHPWRDTLSQQYPNGYPYKNPLITDPVRQQYPYRILAIAQLKRGEWPVWNPYSFSGTLLLANIQTAALYPLNFLFWIFSSEIAWSLLIFLQPLLASVFLYAYLRHLGLGERACFLGGVTFAFSGFMVSWMEWNTIGHVALWLPLALLAKDKLVNRWTWKWASILIFAESSALLAGHLQTALYFFTFINLYLLIRIWQRSQKNTQQFIIKLTPFLIKGAVILLITSVQWIPALNFILSSARQFDLPDWHRPDWFIPWQHLVQFIAPDFFGNPATGNYYGIWNYGEFIGYIALFPLLMAVFAVLARRDKKTLFFAGMLGTSIVFVVPNFISQLPYQLQIPFLATMQPSRIIVLIDFCLAVLAALGLDYIVKPEKERERRIFRVLAFIFLVLVLLWVLVLFGERLGISKEILNVTVAQRNLVLPTGMFVLSAFGMLGLVRFALKKILMTRIFIVLLLSATLFDFYRFFHKFTPFTDAALLFPQTATIEFLQKNIGTNRVMTTDRRILPPNVSTYYKLQSVDGYDPLYLKHYGEMVAAWTREKPDISPAVFNRILTPGKTDSFFADLLGVKYVLSLKEEADPKLKLVFQERETRVYENTEVLPRAFLVEEVRTLKTPGEVMREMYANQNQVSHIAFTDQNLYVKPVSLTDNESAEVVEYKENRVVVRVSADVERLLILTDIYHPDWKVFINEKESTIFPVDFALRGVVVPRGESVVEFRI